MKSPREHRSRYLRTGLKTEQEISPICVPSSFRTGTNLSFGLGVRTAPRRNRASCKKNGTHWLIGAIQCCEGDGMKRIVVIAIVLLCSRSAFAQDWAKERLGKSPRQRE